MKVAKDQIASRSRGHSRPPCDSPSSSRYFFSQIWPIVLLRYLNTGNKNVQLVLQHFCKMG